MMAQKDADYFPRSINQHVTGMAYAADVVHTGDYTIQLGTPPAADPDYIVDAVDFSPTGQATGTITLTNTSVPHKYGVCIDISHGTGVTRSYAVVGRDYLGQPMIEEYADVTSGATQNGNKAFKYIDGVYAGTGAAVTNVNVGFGKKVGVPYKTDVYQWGYQQDTATGVVARVTDTLNAPEHVALTGVNDDPRGTITLAGTPNGTIQFWVDAKVDRTDLYGPAHFYQAVTDEVT